MEVDVNRLQDLREARALSQRELAALAGVGHNTIYRIERGYTKVLPRTVRKLARALEVEPLDLIVRKEGL
jgi:transcriptional regulator with XRE-family HTH domain